MFDIQEEVRKLPTCPGVYIMKEGDTILYVGKAINLKNRVRQYFQSTRGKSPKIRKMISRIEYFEYIVTDSELEALVLENQLIKQNHPPYNTMLQDDKQYPYIKVTVGEIYPRIFVTRRVLHDDARYFGPYTNVSSMRETLDMLKNIWALRHCNRDLPRDIGKERPCLNYHIGQCMGPCTGKVTPEAYRVAVDQALELLNGHYQIVTDGIREKMLKASDALDFEQAAIYRDQIENLKKLGQKQRIDHAGSEDDRDVIALALGEETALIQTFFIRGGKLIGREHFFMDGADVEMPSEIIAAFIQQFYSGTPFVPKELLVSVEPDDRETLEDWLSVQKDSRVHIQVPQRGEKASLMRLAMQNAEITLTQFAEKMRQDELRTYGALQQLADCMGLDDDSFPERIEAYDISNTFGFQSVGSMIVYENGRPKNSDYRKFRIQTVQGANDYASMEEVLTRRFRHAFDEMRKLNAENTDMSLGKFTRLPDLILMDGGRGQVQICEDVLRKFNLDIPVAGMVKDDRHRTRGLIYQDIEYSLETYHEALMLITRIQDEAHRFAITYHKRLRSQNQVSSILDQIEHVGPKRRQDLLQTFGSIDTIRTLSEEDLMKAPSIDRRAASSIYSFFHDPSLNQTISEEEDL